MTSAPGSFFKIERTTSAIKSELLPRVFEIYVTNLLLDSSGANAPVLCLDLLAGLDTQCSSPAAMQWLRQVYSTTNSRNDLNKETQLVLDDADKSVLPELRERLKQLPFYKDLKHPPVVLQDEADKAYLQEVLEAGAHQIVFLNPFSDLFSQEILVRALREEQVNVCLLFSPEELKAFLKKPTAPSPLAELLGERITRIKDFQKQVKQADRREAFFLDTIEQSLKGMSNHSFRFRINQPDKKQPSQYLVFVATMAQTYLQLKELLVRYSDVQEDGVPLFGANLQQQQTALFHEHYTYSIAKLAQELSHGAANYSNRTVQYVYEKHSIGTHYTLENYKTAFDRLMRQGLVRFINPKTGQPVSKLTITSLVRYSLPKK